MRFITGLCTGFDRTSLFLSHATLLENQNSMVLGQAPLEDAEDKCRFHILYFYQVGNLTAILSPDGKSKTNQEIIQHPGRLSASVKMVSNWFQNEMGNLSLINFPVNKYHILSNNYAHTFCNHDKIFYCSIKNDIFNPVF